MKVKVLKNEIDYEAALAEIENIMDSAQPDADQLELLALLVRDYEDKHYPIDLPDPVEAIKFRMEQMGLKRRDLEQYIGNKSKVSEVLSGKRRLSISMIHALHQGLGIPAEVLLGIQNTVELDQAPVKSQFLERVDRSDRPPEYLIEKTDLTEKFAVKMQEIKGISAGFSQHLGAYRAVNLYAPNIMINSHLKLNEYEEEYASAA